MSAARTRALLLRAAATDRTFRWRELEGKRVLAGKCIHCNRAIVVPVDSRVPASGTVEHIVPKTHGGTDAAENIAVACARCNQGKGLRLDRRPWTDPALQAVISTLRERREKRLRAPIEGVPGLEDGR